MTVMSCRPTVTRRKVRALAIRSIRASRSPERQSFTRLVDARWIDPDGGRLVAIDRVLPQGATLDTPGDDNHASLGLDHFTRVTCPAKGATRTDLLNLLPGVGIGMVSAGVTSGGNAATTVARSATNAAIDRTRPIPAKRRKHPQPSGRRR